jgi:hypothetical protein
MERYTKDKLGRVKFTQHTQNPNPTFRPNTRQIEFMRFVNLHGPLSSHYLAQMNPCNKDYFADQLKAVYDGQMFLKPQAQRSTEYPDGHFHVYDLTEKGKQYLKDYGHWVDAVRPTGKWEHQFMVSTITATMDIMCRRNGYRYVPPHEYLQGKSMTVKDVPFEWDGVTQYLPVCPDAVFAIDYGEGSYIAYFLEADRQTEPNIAKTHLRKSNLRTIRQYQSLIKGKLYQEAYGRDAKAMLLFITVSDRHAENFRAIVGNELGKSFNICTGVEDAFRDPFIPPKLLTHLFEGPLLRAGRDAFTIKKETA